STRLPGSCSRTSRTLRAETGRYFAVALTSIAYPLPPPPGPPPARWVCFSDLLVWPRKCRVSANSPSLWPTMFSETKIGTWRRPSCTPIVSPTISGMIVEARDHVRITVRAFERFTASTFLSSFGSMYGPFLTDRDIRYFLRRTMSLSDGLRPRVRLPSVGLPQGDFGPGSPTGAFPSPP